jgi:hypothetical protein
LAVESLEKKIFSEKTDVWAAGVTMWECYSYANTPYETVHFLQVPRMVMEGTRLERPLNCPHDIFSVSVGVLLDATTVLLLGAWLEAHAHCHRCT